MKYFPTLLLVLLTAALSAQTSRLTVTATGCPKLYLYAFDGVTFQVSETFAKNGETFVLDVPAGEPAFRYVGSKPSDVLPLIVGEAGGVSVTGTCGKMRSARATSALNDRYRELKLASTRNKNTFNQAMRLYQAADRKRDTVAMAEHAATVRASDAAKQELLDDAKAQGGILYRIASLDTYLSYLSDTQQQFPSDLDHYVNTYFRFVDFSDPGYGDLPWTYEGSRVFTNTLVQAVRGEQLADILLAVFNRWPAGSRARFFALSGAFASLAQKKHPASAKLSQQIVAEFKADYPSPVASIEQQAESFRAFSVGAEAPLFAGPDPDGNEITLAGLRGKVVLVDFWASWCGPCRRENPNVVKMYAAYKDKGFEILGVSLDKSRDRWVAAIEKDNLTWLHLSDLKGWKSKYARQYGVSSIPQTVLLDREGKIIARNLRGAALEAKLAEVFSGK